MVEQGGGPAATAAVAIARLGGKVTLLAAVGDDPRGRRILQELEQEGVDVSRCIQHPGTTSPLSMVVVDRPAATRTIFYYPGSSKLDPEQVDPDLVRKAGALLLDAHRVEAACAVATVAREAGVPVLFDAGEPKPENCLMALADYPIPPLAAALQATGESDPARAAQALLRPPARAVVVTMGAEGYLVATPEGVWRESAFPVQAVDTTGAGDAFHGGLALGIAWGHPVREAARFAAAVAALKCRKPGGRSGLPTIEEVRSLLGS